MIISVHSVLSYNTNKPIRAKKQNCWKIFTWNFLFPFFFYASLFSFWNELKSDNTEWPNSKMEWRETETMTEKRLLARDGRTTASTPDASVFRPWSFLSWLCPLGLGEGMANGTQSGFCVWSPWGVSGLSRLSRAENLETDVKKKNIFFFYNRKSWNWLFDDKKN